MVAFLDGLATLETEAHVATGHDDAVTLFTHAHRALFVRFILSLSLNWLAAATALRIQSVNALDLEWKPVYNYALFE